VLGDLPGEDHDLERRQAPGREQRGRVTSLYTQDIAAATAPVRHVSASSQISVVAPSWMPSKKDATLTPVQKLQHVAYPIATYTYTYAIVPSQPKQASLLQQFLNFAITPAEQKKGASLTFAPLPASVVAVDKTEIGSL
jgi:ABC-type phosphate transport system substrate-binding protein